MNRFQTPVLILSIVCNIILLIVFIKIVKAIESQTSSVAGIFRV